MLPRPGAPNKTGKRVPASGLPVEMTVGPDFDESAVDLDGPPVPDLVLTEPTPRSVEADMNRDLRLSHLRDLAQDIKGFGHRDQLGRAGEWRMRNLTQQLNGRIHYDPVADREVISIRELGFIP